MNKNEGLKWMKDKNIYINEEHMNRILKVDEPLIGVYGFFLEEKEGGAEKCVYIGRSVNIYSRLFKDGHITKLMKGIHGNEKLSTALKENNKIIVKVLEEVEFSYKSYAKDMHKLALAEYKQIGIYQDKDECLDQLPDGSNMDKSLWDELSKRE